MVNINDIRDKFEKGTNLAVDLMIEQVKKDDGEIVVFQDGKVVHVKARDLK